VTAGTISGRRNHLRLFGTAPRGDGCPPL